MARLQVEELGARILPSAGPVAHSVAPPPHTLAGHGTGTYIHELGIPEVGQRYDLVGSATLAGLGRVSVQGWVESVGFVLHGHAWGTLVLTNAKGSVTLRLEGPQQGGFAALPHQFTFATEGGTGGYRHLGGHGTLQLVISPAMNEQGTFTLTI
jgi:hypothetical protein